MGLKSTTRRGEPSALGVMCILEHQVSGVLSGTLSSTPRRTSRSSPSRTLLCQASGTWEGVLIAVGFAAGFTNKRSGSLSDMSGKLWCSQTLNAEEENQSRINCLMIGKFSSVGSQGRVGVAVGGNVLLGH